MSDTESTKPAAGPETQRQRWAKYGANVVLASVVVVLLGVVATAIAQTKRVRLDTTQGGMYSLKPQTKAIVKDLQQNVRIVSLYTVTKPPPGREKDYIDFATPVADLLDEYKRNSNGKIEVEVIDPTQNPSKVDDLIASVTERYGGEVKQYRDFLAGYTKTHDEIKKLATEETAKVTSLDAKLLETSELGQTVQLAASSLENTLQDMEQANKARERLLQQKPPNYKGAVDAVRDNLATLSAIAREIVKRFTAMKDDKAAPDPVKAYAAEAAPRYEALGKRADAVGDEIKKLGELKLDDLRQTLRARDGIVVMGPKDMRVLTFEQVWQTDPNVRRMLNSPDKQIKPQFAGEQQITSAILGLTQEKKPKVAFVRAGGPPMTNAGAFFGPPPGDLSRVAARLREFNFEVLEKDLSGMWAMQAQMQQRGMPPEPEPDDEAIKDAVWIVVASRAQPGPMGPPATIGNRVAEHLKAGGSALVLASPQGEDMNAALADYGIKVRSDAVVVHEPIVTEGGQTGDFIDQARRIPFVFVVNEYGQHMLAKPLQSLDTPMVAAVPVSTEPKPGVKQWNLVPLTSEQKTWGETNIEGLSQGEDVKYDEAADVAGPLFAGAVAHKEQGEGRVVVVGNTQFATNDMLRIPDRILLEQQGVVASRFPGSLELFTNSVFWLAKMEPMIAISPAAMEVSRIEPMSKGGAAFWRNGVLLFGLPLLVVLAGGLMWVRRRD